MCVWRSSTMLFLLHTRKTSKKHTFNEENALSVSLLCIYCFVVESKLLSILLFSIHASQRTTHLSKPMAYVSPSLLLLLYSLFGVYTTHHTSIRVCMYVCLCEPVCTPPMYGCECVGVFGSIFISVVYSAVETLTSCLCR